MLRGCNPPLEEGSATHMVRNRKCPYGTHHMVAQQGSTHQPSICAHIWRLQVVSIWYPAIWTNQQGCSAPTLQPPTHHMVGRRVGGAVRIAITRMGRWCAPYHGTNPPYAHTYATSIWSDIWNPPYALTYGGWNPPAPTLHMVPPYGGFPPQLTNPPTHQPTIWWVGGSVARWVGGRHDSYN